jgi:hypothetical protein
MGWKSVCLAQLTALGVFYTAGATTLTVTPDKVQAGEQVEVAWQASPGTQVVWLGVGPTPVSGKRLITPAGATTVPFLFELGDRVEFRSRSIQVIGVRGKYELPKRDQYGHPSSNSVPAIGFTSLCQRVMSLFQQELGFDKPEVLADLDASGDVRSLYFRLLSRICG